jgi:WS/DGAT/MGAT family acyltransferase
MGTMKHLSALDALFLQLETPETPMHVGSVMILEKPKAARGKKADAYGRFRDHFASRLHIAPVFTRRLAEMPLDLASPIWIDGAVDLDYHVGRLTLPKPGTTAQLEAAVAKLHEGPLDRSHPLWQFTVIDGLAGGDVAVYAKIHHAALDGQGGVAVAQALLDTERSPKRGPGQGIARPRIAPTTARMLRDTLLHTVSQYGTLIKSLPALVKAAGRAGAVAYTAPQPKKSRMLGPPTPMNVAIGAKRVFVTRQIPLAETKEIARRFEVTLNDVVLATCAGALRRQFAGNKAALAKAMIGAVPASLRLPGDTSKANDVTMMRVGLATQLADPLKRLAAIHTASQRAKMITGSMKDSMPTDLPSLGIPWLMAAVSALYRKASRADRLPALANLVISNVPGPPVPLYMAGALLKSYFPVSIVIHGLAFNITILSYNGAMGYGLIACKRAMPGLRTFSRNLQAAHDELLALARKP